MSQLHRFDDLRLRYSQGSTDKLLPLTHASTFDVYTREQMPLAAGDVVRFTKNFVAKGGKCRNNDLATVQTVT